MADQVVKRGRGRPPGSRNKPRPDDAAKPAASVAKAPVAAKVAAPHAAAKPPIAKPVVADQVAPMPTAPVVMAMAAEIAAPVEAAVRQTADLGKALATDVAEASRKDKAKMASAAESMTAKGTKAAEAGAERAKAMFGDLNDRTKTAMEKGSKAFEDAVEFAKGNVEAAVASSRAAAKGTETLVQDAADFGRKHFEKAQGVAKSYATVKSPTEFMQLSSDYSRATFDAMVAEASRLSEAYVKVMSDVVEPISSRFSAAAEKFKPTSL